MREVVERWPTGFRIIAFEELQGYTDRDITLLGSAEVDLFRHHWESYLAEPDGTRPPHPDEFLRLLACSIQATRRDSYDLAILISRRTRFHLATVKLPRSKFVTCLHNWNYNKRPYLVVTQDWFDEILRTQFSLYGLVDAIGMRQLLSVQGHVKRQQITALRDGIDALANAHSDHAFLTFADTVVVKTNWSMSGDSYYEGTTYNPERFLRVLESVRSVVRAALALDAYAVVTQGANLAAEDGLMSLSQGRNHVFFGSLGTLFAQLAEMDLSIRAALRKQTHGPKQFYLAHWLVLSLHWKSYDTRDVLSKRFISFDSKLSTPDECAYLPIDAGELFSLVTET